MNTCNMCEYWEPSEGYFCPSNKGYCNQPCGGNTQPQQPAQGAQGHGEPGAPGRLITGPLFGCIHFVQL
jgi:hypothetical protein